MLLTRLPVGRVIGGIGGVAPPMAASAWAWPLVGLIAGLVAAAVHALAHWAGLPPLPAALLAIGTLIVVTGAMHEDGLADLADGFWGGRTPARRLEIMRDSRIGSYGVLALGLSLMLRVTALASLPPAVACAGIVSISVASRAAMPAALRIMPSARTDGLGHAAGRPGRPQMVAALVIAAAFWLWFFPAAFLPAFALMALAAALVGRIALAKIGGQTGDVLGAIQQVAEIAGWLVLAAQPWAG
jgi:adenosylcobinamide-GDP ribazoletransferase